MAEEPNLVELTVELVAAHLSNNMMHANDVPGLIERVHETLAKISAPALPETSAEEQARPRPAVTARKSTANPDFILSMIDGKPYKSLKRHISTHGYTPQSYRETFALPSNYPMVAPSYAEQRRALARKIGLGRRKGEPQSGAASKPASGKAASRGRRRAGAASASG